MVRLKSWPAILALACAAPAWAALSPPSTALSETFVSYSPVGSNARCPGGVVCRPYGTPKTWVAPASGIYTLTLAGGEGGGFMSLDQYDPGMQGSQYLDPVPGGRGAIVSGDYRIAAGTKLVIIAAQAGSQSNGSVYGLGTDGNGNGLLVPQGGGGGGGSFVFAVPNFVVAAESGRGFGYDLSQGTLLAAAGGGGGAGPSYYNPIPSSGLAGRNGGSSRYLDEAFNLGGVDGGAGKDVAYFDQRPVGYFNCSPFAITCDSQNYIITGYVNTFQQAGGSAGASFREAADGRTGGSSAAGFFDGSGVSVLGRTRTVNGLSAPVANTGLGGYGGGGGGGMGGHRFR
jgi:hypothetical protein